MAARGTLARWAAVALLVTVLVALPSVVAALPADDADVPAADLRAAVLAASDVGFSGYAVSAGGLALPVSDRLTAAADLFSDRTLMRVWWRDPDEHRVDVVAAAGETGVHRDPGGTWTWDFEAGTATRGRPASLALPAPPDLLPAALGRRLLSEATDEEVTRVGARRVAGRDALGLRVVPAEPASSVARVDVWVDPASGLPLQVQVFGEDAVLPALDTRFLDLDLAVPPADVVAFTPPPDATVLTAPDTEGLIAEAGERAPDVRLPPELAGLPRRSFHGVPGAVGVYGRGVTLLAAVPVPQRLAAGLREALTASPEAVVDPLGTRVAAGPLGLMLAERPGGPAYVLTGTVTLDALGEAARRLPGAPA
ncbi:sigma-E factor regulatory protein RseB domain-containing protein [Geodermatophilus sp. DSM 44513]|uniref:sigma-E factor regulatory protein RseB domain-containing protein n=1 Tax=Geodermatophilus sp. DSM 44513 TaxID=1528104 RepID=UPI00126DCA6A|nr:sigma-E factor regulatory protein RseB domain-containing protein [Geodermatophilus sp. DSM 44513]WNV77317.1 transcriptional regulator [Geodermatophilus sp. DSM 44513]